MCGQKLEAWAERNMGGELGFPNITSGEKGRLVLLVLFAHGRMTYRSFQCSRL
jgi:hypothetical protein